MKGVIQIGVLLFLLGTIIPVSHAFAKGGPQVITIEGPRLAAPIKVTDPETLSLFADGYRTIDPRAIELLSRDSPIPSTQLIDFASGAIPAPQVSEPYRIWFGGDSGYTYYAMNYYPNPTGGRGYIHDFYVGGSGKWFRVSQEGDLLLRQLLKEHGVSLAPSASPLNVELNGASVWIVTLAIALGIGVFISLRRRIRRATMQTRR